MGSACAKALSPPPATPISDEVRRELAGRWGVEFARNDSVAPGELDLIDEWIRMVALNRLTGHSAGFFSVYTLPPNQAVSVKSQIKINEKRKQVPPRRDVAKLILKKSRSLIKDITSETAETLRAVAVKSLLTTAPAAGTKEIPAESVSLVVTSPPFLDVVQYAIDNWLRCWFAGFDAESVAIPEFALTNVRDGR